MDCSPPGSSVHGISRGRILEWVAIPLPEDLPNPGIEPHLVCLLYCRWILYHWVTEAIYIQTHTYTHIYVSQEEGTTTHSSILAWRLPWTEEPGGLQFTGLQRVRHHWSHLAPRTHKYMCIHACIHTHAYLCIHTGTHMYVYICKVY